MVPDEQVEAERRALRDAVAGLLAGLTNQSQIARAWNAAGLVTATGQRWTSDRVRDTLLRPVLCGRIEYDGELISRMPGDPLIGERDWLRLRALVESRRRGRPHSLRYLASGVLRCGGCGTKMSGHTATTRGRELRRYICHAHRGGCGVTIEMTGTDRELRVLTIARLSDSRYAAAIATARAQVSQRLAVVNAEIEQIEALAAALSEKVGRREMTLADFDKSYSFLRADLDPLVAEREQLAGGSIGGPTQALSGAQVARHWDEAESVQERRAMLDRRHRIGSGAGAALDPGLAGAHVQPGPDRARPRRRTAGTPHPLSAGSRGCPRGCPRPGLGSYAQARANGGCLDVRGRIRRDRPAEVVRRRPWDVLRTSHHVLGRLARLHGRGDAVPPGRRSIDSLRSVARSGELVN